jgi:hypothetical protein
MASLALLLLGDGRGAVFDGGRGERDAAPGEVAAVCPCRRPWQKAI